MSVLLARSPYIVKVDGTGLANSRLDLYFTRLGDAISYPDPQYSLRKDIPSTNNPDMLYNISPFAKEYIVNAQPTIDWTNWNIVGIELLPETEFVICTGYIYEDNVEELIFAKLCFNGFEYYEAGGNKQPVTIFDPTSNLGVLMTEGTYYFLSDCEDPNGRPLTNFDYRPTNITVVPGEDWYMKITRLANGVETDVSLTSYNYTPIVVKSIYFASGFDESWKVEFYNADDELQWSSTFIPQTETKYDPVVIDFVNKFGAWQRTHFYKAQNTNIEITTSEYNLLQSDYPLYDVQEGTKKIFNVNGQESIKVNSGWVTEDYSQVIKEIMLSERILVNSRPAKMRTKNTELFKHINTKQINYQLEFDYAHDIINHLM